MKKGQVILVAVFVFVVAVAAVAFLLYFYDASLSSRTVQERTVEIVEEVSAAEKLMVPQELSVSALIGEDNRETFEVVNLNDEIVRVSCDFPNFQEFVPSSNCFTYDGDGNFVGEGDVRILPGQKHEFVASVTPFENTKIQKGRTEVLIDIKAGVYSGEIELSAWFEGENEKVSVVTIPVRIFVEG